MPLPIRTRRHRPPMFPADDSDSPTLRPSLIDKARRFGRRVLAPRAAQHDRDATFPIENFRDMHARRPARHLHPEGATAALGADFQTYCLAAAELGRYCGATALSWNMHVCSTLWTGALADDLPMTRGGARRARRAPPRALSPHRRGRRDLRAAVLRGRRGGRRRGGVRHRGAAGRRRLPASTARRSSPRCRAPPTTTACCAPSAPKAKPRAAATRSISPCRRMRRASRWSATGIRSACAARSRARCCSRTCSCPRTRC